MAVHPIDTTNKLRDVYRRYLQTLYPFQDDNLRRQFERCLNTSDQLVKQPLLEASFPFESGQSIQQLVQNGILSPNFADLCRDNAELPFERPLHWHQAEAIRLAQQQNIVVATGTGSGKTESFLIPVINSLLHEQAAGTLDQPGIRVLLLYPMNALANDQLKRLRAMLRNYPAITFGRYVGETEPKQAEAAKQYLNEYSVDPLPNEFISREVMQQRPPHLLLTNYAMLEFLLLRPSDTPFFDGETAQHWQFIVVDEAHVYGGANGMEVGMLLRRLKDRLFQSARGHVRCIATSATLGSGEKEDPPKVAEFAQTLFGEPFTPAGVIAARRKNASMLQATAEFTGSPTLYAELAGKVSDGPDALLATARPFVPSAVYQAASQAQSVPAILYQLLKHDGRLHRLQVVLETKVSQLDVIQKEVFADSPDVDAQALTDLVALAAQAHIANDAPLLPARYHVFAKALEGAFVCFNSVQHAGQIAMRLSHHEQCPECQAMMFELGCCSRCGTAYLVGEKSQQDATLRLQSGQRKDDAPIEYYLLADTVNQVDEEADIAAEFQKYTCCRICVNCGKIQESASTTDCGCGNPVWRTAYKMPYDGTKNTPLHCPQCSTKGSSAVYRLRTGQDAPVSVLADALYNELSAAPIEPHLSAEDQAAYQPGQGRKLLIFADSRQDAAFFAPYLERNHETILRRQLIYQVLAKHQDEARADSWHLDVLVSYLKNAVETQCIIKDIPRIRTLAKTWLRQELIGIDRRQTLEYLGLLQLKLRTPENWHILEKLPALAQAPWQLTETAAQHLWQVVIDTLRWQNIVNFPDGVEYKDIAFEPVNQQRGICDISPKNNQGCLFSWEPKTGTNARLDYLQRVLQRCAPTLSQSEQRAAALALLQQIWQNIVDKSNILRKDGLFNQKTLNNCSCYEMSYNAWQWWPVTAQQTIFVCDRCQTVSYGNAANVCQLMGCSGVLQPISAEAHWKKTNHYRQLYRQAPNTLIPMAVQEHTAQWTAEKGRKIQEDFVKGHINVLSCSTTFELGVDVGSLQTVLMRNMPPLTANYLQRAGRAGRRANSVSYVLTFAQRRSHDLAYYRQPEKMIRGQMPVPNISIRNPKVVQRHLHAVALSLFFRQPENHDLYVDIGDFLAANGYQRFRDYLAAHPADLSAALQRILQQAGILPSLYQELQLEDWGWVKKLTDLDHIESERHGVFDRAVTDTKASQAYYEERENESKQACQYEKARHFQKTLKTILGRDLITYFSRNNILPKYGFPVDVVELQTNHIVSEPLAEHVDLQRDLQVALAEFAPGGEVVAAKKVWTSAGLKHGKGKKAIQYQFVFCPNAECGRLNVDSPDKPLKHCVDCHETLNFKQNERTFIMPEFGFIASQIVKDAGNTRPERLHTTRTHFNSFDDDAIKTNPSEQEHQQRFQPAAHLAGVSSQYSRFGKMRLLNLGSHGLGFRYCSYCGWASPITKNGSPNNQPPKKSAKGATSLHKHKDPRNGADCTAKDPRISTIHLGHEFTTDILQIRLPLKTQREERPTRDKNPQRSLLYALLEGATEVLGIRRSDIDGTLRFDVETRSKNIILFDAVPGGVGYMKLIQEQLADVMKTGLNRMEACECGAETACHGCLWDYRNQFYHHELSRGAALKLLKTVLL